MMSTESAAADASTRAVARNIQMVVLFITAGEGEIIAPWLCCCCCYKCVHSVARITAFLTMCRERDGCALTCCCYCILPPYDGGGLKLMLVFFTIPRERG